MRKRSRYNSKRLNEILVSSRKREGALIPILQEVQEAFGYIPCEAIGPIAEALGIFPSQVFGVLTFYAQFRLKPVGENVIRICHGTACHVGGAEKITDTICQELGVEEGETTKDGRFSVERVFCVGSCSLAPVIRINGQTFGRLNQQSARKIIRVIKRSQRTRDSNGETV
jgi:NADH-quinone oxidoreductase subunit E